MPSLFIDAKSLQTVKKIIKENYPQALVWAYGSRVNGNAKTAHEGSDLDLAVKDFGAEDKDIYKLREAFTNSNIPFLIDIFDYDRLPTAFHEEIKQKYLVIYDGNT